jgi:hypothetical protein
MPMPTYEEIAISSQRIDSVAIVDEAITVVIDTRGPARLTDIIKSPHLAKNADRWV